MVRMLMQRKFLISMCALMVLATACNRSGAEPVPLFDGGEHTLERVNVLAGQLGPDDVFEIRVYGEKELSGVYRVSTDGTIDFPLLGRVIVSGRTAATLNVLLTERLHKYLRQPHVSVFVKDYNSQKVFVFGKVNRPGTFEFTQGMNIVEAITLAGGFERTADENGTYVTRSLNGKEQRIRVPVEDIGEGKVVNLFLIPGDIVYVPETIF